MSRARQFCFTWNNWTEKTIVALEELQCKYLLYGKEVATTGTKHLQGCVVYKDPCTESAARKRMKGAHVEICKGNLEQNETYCKKDGDWIERGIKPMTQKEKGEANSERWDAARAAAEKGDWEAIPSELWTKYQNSYRKMQKQNVPEPLQEGGDTVNEWIYGPAGTGKSTRAAKENPGAYYKGCNKWWDGYTDQTAVIIDDMDPFHKSLSREFKMWGQHQPFNAEVKGGSCCLRPPKIVVTSNYSIDEIWEDVTTREAMHRRYKEIHVPGDKLYPPFVPGFNPYT